MNVNERLRATLVDDCLFEALFSFDVPKREWNFYRCKFGVVYTHNASHVLALRRVYLCFSFGSCTIQRIDFASHKHHVFLDERYRFALGYIVISAHTDRIIPG